MFLIEKASNALASGIASSLNMDKEKEEVIAYGAFAFLQILWSITLVMLFGIIFNVFFQSLAVSLAISILRKYSGGVHSSSPNRCAFIGAIISTAIALLAKLAVGVTGYNLYMYIVTVSFVISYVIVNKLAPVDSESKPIKKLEKRKRLKRASFTTIHFLLMVTVVLSVAYLVFNVEATLTYALCICIGVVWQSFTLTRSGHLILGTIDNLLKKVLV